MANDLRDAILAKLDDLAAEHQPCDPGADCLHRVVDAARAAVQFAAEHPALVLVEGELLARIAEAMGIREGSNRG